MAIVGLSLGLGIILASAAPTVNILGKYAVVNLNATTTANTNFTVSGTVAFVGLGSTGSPCLIISSSSGLIATSTCGGSDAITTSSQLVNGQWLIASAYNTIYSTTTQPAISASSPITLSATGNLTWSNVFGFSSSTPSSTINGFTGTIFDILAGSGLSRSITNGSTTFYGVATSTAQKWTANQEFLAFASTTQLISASTTLNGQTQTASVSSTNITASGYGVFPALSFTNASGTNLDASNYLRIGSVNVVTSSVTSALRLATASGADSAYGGASACAASNFVTTISAAGATTCSSAITSLANVSSTNITVSGYLQIASPNSIKDANGNSYSTSTPASLAGKYLGVLGSQLTVSSTLASTTAAATNWDATTTAQYRYFLLMAPNYPFTLSSFSCENVFATTTYEIIRTTDAVATSGVEIIPSITCSAGVANTTSTFANSTLTSGQFMVAAVTSTVGTPTRDSIWWAGFK